MDQQKAQQDLAYIRELMAETRQATYVSGAYFIIWGLTIGVGLLFTWLFVSGILPLPLGPRGSSMLVWTLCLAFGGAWMWWWPIRRENRAPAQGAGGRLIGMSWFAVGVAMLLVYFVGVGSGSISGSLMPALSGTFVGIGIFMTGTLSGMGWIRNLAFGWWIGGAAMLASPGLWNLWMMALMLFGLYLVPGIILSRSPERK